MKKKKMLGIIIASIAIFLLSVFGIYKQATNDKYDVNYSTFLTQVEAHKVSKVELGNSSKIKYELNGDSHTYTTDNPRKEGFKEALLLNNIEVVENSQNAISIMQYLLSTGLMVGMFIFIYKTVKKQGSGDGAMSLGIAPVPADVLKEDFNSIAGNIEVKEQVQDVIDFIREPEKYSKMGARMPKGLIFYGPPGTGKTLMAKAIAKEAGVPFFSLSGSDFVQLYVGVGASRVREMFKAARKEEKAVIFIDEIDAIGKKRSSNAMSGNDEKDQTLNALLTEMSGFKESDGIVVIAATNRLDILDEALLRPGRFDRQIEVGYPDLAARRQIINLHLKNKPLSDEVDLEALSSQTVYFTGAMLENLLNEAAICAANEERNVIVQQDIDTAFYTVIAGKEKRDRSGTSKLDREITAYHEAGHALITKLLAPENSVTKVTIIPSTKGAGGFSMNIPKDHMYLTKAQIMTDIKISLAGRAAEELIFGKENVTTGASNDIEKASQALKNYIVKYGMDETYGLINLQVLTEGNGFASEKLIKQCTEHMRALYEETLEVLRVNRELLESITERLLEKETLNEKEIASFFS